MSNEFVYSTGRTPAEVYEELHRTSDYATTEHGLNTEHLYRDCRSLLDVGCGRSPFAGRMKRELGPDVAVCDVSATAVLWQREQGIMWSYCANLATGFTFPDQSVDAVTCFDVLEHLPPERVGFAIRELCRVARKRVVITVGTQPSKRKGPGGEELHLTVHDERWWHSRIGQQMTQGAALRTEQIEARIRRGQPAVSTVFIVELQP